MNLNLLKPNKENLFTYIVLGMSLLTIGFIDIFTNTFLNFNITGFFPGIISYFSPVILGAFALLGFWKILKLLEFNNISVSIAMSLFIFSNVNYFAIWYRFFFMAKMKCTRH